MKLKHTLAVTAGLLIATTALADEEPGLKRVMVRVKEIVNERCSLCHGSVGESANGTSPRIAAQHPAYIVKQLSDFRDGRRKGTAMNEMAKDLTNTEIAGLAVYFSTRKPVSRKSGDTDFLAVGYYIFHKGNAFSGVAPCASCHGEKGLGTVQLPRLAGQYPAYIESQLIEFNRRERTNDNAIMHVIASKMTVLEIKAVAAYIGGLE